MSNRRIGWVVAISLAWGCGDEPLTLTDGPDPGHEPEMFRTVLKHLTQPKNLPQQGDWPDDFGDANFYGPGFLFRYGKTGDNSHQVELAQETHVHNTELLKKATKSIGILMNQLEDVMMACFGMLEAHHHKPDDASRKLLDTMLGALNVVGKAVSYYPEDTTAVGGYGVDTYGPSTTNATLALLNLEHALIIGGSSKKEHIATAESILTTGRTKAFDATRGYYQFSSKRSGLYLYPNITQMISHLRAYELTGKKLYLDRARDLHKAIQPLKVKGEGRYRSPYSAKYMGAKTDDYTTFSSQNFTMIGLSLLFQQTQDAKYKKEITEILAFIRTRLLSEGRVLHHWMDGKLAKPKDPEYYCSGCNLQMLYVIHRLDELLAPKSR